MYCSMVMLFEKITLWYSLLRDFHMIKCLNLIAVQTSKGKVQHIYKELIKRIITFEYENMLLLKSPQNKVASNIAITKQNKTSQTYHICQEQFEIKVFILQTNQ